MTLRSNLIRLAHEQPALREKLLPLLKNAGQPIYEDLDLDESSGVGEKLKEFVDQLKHDAREMLEQADAVEKAWGNWDVDTLVDLGALTTQDRDHLKAAWKAQQAGDEEEMEKQIERVASKKNAMNPGILRSVQSHARRETFIRAQDAVTEAQEAIKDLIGQVDTRIGFQYASEQLQGIQGRLEDIGLEMAPLRRYVASEKKAGGRVQDVKKSLWYAIRSFRSTAESLLSEVRELQSALVSEGIPLSGLVRGAPALVQEAEERVNSLLALTR